MIDVREPHEWEIARVEGADLKPLSQLAAWAGELDPAGGPYVLYCHHGVRSMHACTALGQQGVQNLYNLVGGIDRWSREVDSSVPTY